MDGVDPSDHFERRHAKPDMPPLVDTWRIDTISMQTAPFGEISVLDCVRMDVPPKRTSATAA